MMDLKFVNPKELSGNAKATVHKTGKLGFSTGAANRLGLNDQIQRYARIAVNNSSPSDENLYMIVSKEKTEDSFKISKAGDYYYINLKYFFEDYNIDYKEEDIVYNIKLGDFAENAFILERKEDE